MERFVVKRRKKEYAIITYNIKTNNWSMKINKNLDLTTCPAFIYCLAINKKYNVDNWKTLDFLHERLIPSSRQNINQVLKLNKMDKYSEYDFLVLSKGKCTMDNCSIERIMK